MSKLNQIALTQQVAPSLWIRTRKRTPDTTGQCYCYAGIYHINAKGKGFQKLIHSSPLSVKGRCCSGPPCSDTSLSTIAGASTSAQKPSRLPELLLVVLRMWALEKQLLLLDYQVVSNSSWCRGSLSLTISQSLPKFMSIELVMSIESVRSNTELLIQTLYLLVIIYPAGFLIKDRPPCSMEKAMAPHSSTLAWKIPWAEEPGRLQSMGSLRVGHDWATSLSLLPCSNSSTSWRPLVHKQLSWLSSHLPHLSLFSYAAWSLWLIHLFHHWSNSPSIACIWQNPSFRRIWSFTSISGIILETFLSLTFKL